MHERLVVHTVGTMEADGRGIVFTEQVVGVHQVVVVAEKADYPTPLFIIHSQEILLGNVLILLHQSLGDDEILHAVFPRTEEMLLARQSVTHHGVTDGECRVNHDTVEAIDHLRVHTSHRRAHNEVRLSFLTQLPQHVDGFLRMQRYILGDDSGLGQHLTQTVYRARLRRRAKAMHIHDFLARHDVGKLFDITVFHIRCCSSRIIERQPSCHQ